MSDGRVNDAERSPVLFLNEFEDDAGREQVRDAMGERFSLGAEALARLFAGPPVVARSNVDADTAFRYERAIEAMAAKCRIEAMPAGNDTDAQGYLGRRRGERRPLPERRSRTRAGAISPDRGQGDRHEGREGPGERIAGR